MKDRMNRDDFHIRKMRVGDIPAAAELEREVFSEPWSEQGFCDALAREENIFLTACDGDTLVGYCGLYAAGNEGNITNVAVAEAYRRRGIASELIAALKIMAAKRQITRLFLEVRESNVAAQALYEHQCFKACGFRKNFYRKPDEGAILMACRL